MIKINYKFLSIILILGSTVNYIFFLNRFFVRENGFILGDWIINYEGGFTRRGFLGEIIVSIVGIFDLNLITFSFFFVSFLFLIFIFFLVRLIIISKINFLIILLIFSPLTILFNFFDPLAIGRKEFIFFLFFLIYLFYRNSKFSNYVLPIFAIIVTLTHELMFFLTPFIFVSRFIQSKKYNLEYYKVEIIIFILSLICFLLIIIYGNSNSNVSCELITSLGLSDKACWAINLTSGSKPIFDQFKINIYYLSYYSIFIFVLIFHISLILKKNLNLSMFELILSILITFLPILSIFILVNDWGRYINIFVFMWMIIIIFNNKIEDNNNFNFIKFFMVLLFSSSFYMPHCCPEIHFSNIKYKPSVYYMFERINYRLSN